MLLEAMRRIPIEYQLVLELSFWEGLSGVEIAEILGIPEPTVRSRMRRGTSRLRDEMQQLTDAAAALRDTAEDLDTWAARVRSLMQDER